MVDAYNLLYAALLLTAGALGDLYGRRRIFAYGVVLFAAGTAICAAAPTTEVMLAGRALTGVGAALELPMSLVLPRPRLSRDARSPARGRHLASCNGLAFIVGPTLGGLLVATVGWRSIFYMVLPLCAATLVLAWKSVEESASPQGRRLDLRAARGDRRARRSRLRRHRRPASRLVFHAGADRGRSRRRGRDRVRHRRARTRGGLVPFELFRSRPFSASLAVAGLMTFGMYAQLFLLPLYFQTLRGDSTLMAGVHMLPMSVAFFLVSQSSGRISPRFRAARDDDRRHGRHGRGRLAIAFVGRHGLCRSSPPRSLVVGVGWG